MEINKFLLFSPFLVILNFVCFQYHVIIPQIRFEELPPPSKKIVTCFFVSDKLLVFYDFLHLSSIFYFLFYCLNGIFDTSTFSIRYSRFSLSKKNFTPSDSSSCLALGPIKIFSIGHCSIIFF